MRARSWSVAWLVVALGAGPGGAQGPRVTLVPASPVQGTLFRVRLEGIGAEAAGAVAGSFAGEPLHFAATDNGGAEALAAVPIEAAGADTLRLVVPGAAAGGDTVRIAVPITRGQYRLERLSVAPRFGREPDAATAARIERERERAQAVSRASHGTPRLWGGGFVRPRAARVTSGFGEGREFNGAVDSRHMGTDFAGAMGEPVRAAGRGVVALVDNFYLAGNAVYIDHGAGLVTAYFHLSATDVAPGDTVEAGQVIGRVGATGRVTGPHLHWVARYGGIDVDPLSLLAVAPAR
ncbi:MAG TPA: M23 family metallopeptidase [Longimicrobiales bacterium]|nr:M23 family metallopeptidase [Longimicrobiales bacterium]